MSIVELTDCHFELARNPPAKPVPVAVEKGSMRSHNYYVYIVASASRTLYIGVTNDLERRIWQHRHKTLGSFTAKYDVTRLVWFEWHTRIDDAIAREKQIKGWGRVKKLGLIEAENPKWWDLSRDWEI